MPTPRAARPAAEPEPADQATPDQVAPEVADQGTMPTVFQALGAVMAEVQSVAKSDRNTHQNFNFRGIDAVVNAVGPALRKHGVIVTPDVLEAEYDSITVGQNRTVMGHVRLKVAYVFYGPAGDWLRCVVVGEAMDAGDKGTPKAMSVAFRTALLQALCLPTDEPDPDEQNYQRSAAETPARGQGARTTSGATRATAEPAPAAATMSAEDQAAYAAAVTHVASITDQDALRAFWMEWTDHLDVIVTTDGGDLPLRDVIMARKAELDGAAS